MLGELLIAFGFVALAILALILVRRRVPFETLEQQHEVAGVCFAVVGGLYGIILAFVLVSSWERYENARVQTEVEASLLADLYRHAQAFQEPTRTNLSNAVIAYMDSVLVEEWPAMNAERQSQATQKRYYAIGRSVLEVRPSESWEVALYQNTLDKLDSLGDARRHRLLYLRSGLPEEIWIFLIVFGVCTVGFTYFFGMRSLVPQILITAILASTIAGSLLLVNETQHPFAGGLRVPDTAFRLALGFIHNDRLE